MCFFGGIQVQRYDAKKTWDFDQKLAGVVRLCGAGLYNFRCRVPQKTAVFQRLILCGKASSKGIAEEPEVKQVESSCS